MRRCRSITCWAIVSSPFRRCSATRLALAAPTAAWCWVVARDGANSMTTLTAYIEGIGLLGPGLNGWPGSQPLLTGEQPYLPAPTLLPAPLSLPAAERR